MIKNYDFGVMSQCLAVLKKPPLISLSTHLDKDLKYIHDSFHIHCLIYLNLQDVRKEKRAQIDKVI